MRILVVNYRYFVSGGPERYMFGVSKLLEEAGHEVVPFSVRYAKNVPSDWSGYFVSPIAGEDAVYYRQHAQTPKTVLKSLERAFYSPEVYRSLTRLMRDARPDVAFVLHYLRKLSPSVLAALRDAGVPIVVRLSDFQMVCPQASLVRDGRTCEDCVGGSALPSIRHRCVQGSLAASVVNAAAMAAARRLRLFEAVDRFVAPSSVMREKMIAGGHAAERIVHIPTFVAVEPPGRPPERRRRLVYVGRLEPIKGTEVLVDAFAALRRAREFGDVELMLVGDDSTPYARGLKDRVRARSLEGVVFTGALDEAGVAQALSSSSLSVVPSVCTENLPNSLLESLACGTPVVGSRISSITEALQGGDAGATFNLGDSDDLARHLARLLGDRSSLEAMRLEARRLASTRFSPSRHLDALLAVFSEVTSERQSPRTHSHSADRPSSRPTVGA